MSEDFDVKQVRITVDTGTATIRADPLFDRVFHHLFDNALRHGETVTGIRISLQQTGSSGLLLVENNGVSIRPPTRKRSLNAVMGKAGASSFPGRSWRLRV